MNLKDRIERVEKSIGGYCVACGSNLRELAETRNNAALRDEALRLLDEYKAVLDGDEAKALTLLAEDAPTLARLLGYGQSIG